MASPSATQATRRRRRSTRLSVAVGLLVQAVLVVFGAALSGSWLLATCAAGLGVLLGAAATRITHTELVEARVHAARDRATQAQAFNQLNDQRLSEHASYVADVHARLADRQQALEQLEVALAGAQRRAATATRRLYAEGRRAAGLQAKLTDADERAAAALLRVSELEHEVLVLRSELESVAVTVAWPGQDLHRRHA